MMVSQGKDEIQSKKFSDPNLRLPQNKGGILKGGFILIITTDTVPVGGGRILMMNTYDRVPQTQDWYHYRRIINDKSEIRYSPPWASND